jgi:hypothetical protein
MTGLLEKAVSEAAKLPEKEQDALAAIIMDEIVANIRWGRAFEDSPDSLAALAGEPREEHRT